MRSGVPEGNSDLEHRAHDARVREGAPDGRQIARPVVRRSFRSRRLAGLIAALTMTLAGAALAQFEGRRFDGFYRPLPNIPYDGRFTFVRVRYTPAPGGYWP